MHAAWRFSVDFLANLRPQPPRATEASGEDTGVPVSGGAVAYSVLERLLIGRPLASREFEQQREYVEDLDQRWSSDTRGADLRPARQRRTASR